MNRILIFSAFFCIGTAGFEAKGQSAAPTAEELIAKNIEAKRGLAAMKAITSLRMKGKLETHGIVILLGADRMPDFLVRQTVTIQGMTQVQAYDGAERRRLEVSGW
jgi:hypothetical protein